MSKKNKNHPFFRAKSEDFGDIFFARHLGENYDYKSTYNQYRGEEIIERVSTRQETPKFYYLKNGTTIYDSDFISFKTSKHWFHDNKSEKMFYEAERIAQNLCLTKKEEELYMNLLENRNNLNPKLISFMDNMFFEILSCYKRLYISRRKNAESDAKYSLFKFLKSQKRLPMSNPLPLP